MMSQSIGPFCDLNQDITSFNGSEGAAVALELLEYEREREYDTIEGEIVVIYSK